MIFELIKDILNTNLGSEGGELLFAFLIAHTQNTGERPTLENTKILTETDDTFKIAYLQDHFLRIDEVIKVIASIIHATNKKILYPYLRQYIKITGKRFSIWTYAPNKESPFSHPHRFGDDNFPLSIIDPFRGNKPVLINNESVVLSRTDIACLPQIILDSHILNYIAWYANDQSKLQESKIDYVRRMLQYFVENKYLYSPHFYYFESTRKGSSEQDLRNTFSLFIRLQCLNKELMLNNGLFIFDDNKFSELKNNLNLSNIDEMIDYFIADSRKVVNDDQLILIDIVYCILLKTILIEKFNHHIPIRHKICLFKEFLEKIVQSQFSYELAIAICYFSGKLQRFLNIQKGIIFEKAKRKLLSCSWDMLLLRQPDLLLPFGNQESSIISSICTNDISLLIISNIFRLGFILRFVDDDIFLTGHELNEGYLLKLIGEDIYVQIEDILKVEPRLSPYGKNRVNKISGDALTILKSELERDLLNFISNH